MLILRQRAALKTVIRRFRTEKKTIGFVPTMGSLHEGHLSLVRRARRENKVVIASLFVNPLQFGPREDMGRYPRDFKRDRRLFEASDVNILYAPDLSDFYPPEFQTQIALSKLSKPLCGRTRPIHFAGVATVVLKLLSLVRPTRVYLGQKDFQQIRVIEQLIEDMDLAVKVVRCPIVREKDGLAMSSRNVFLSPGERKEAFILSRSLREAAKHLQQDQMNPRETQKRLVQALSKVSKARIDYAEIVDARTLERVVDLRKGHTALVAAALFFSRTRLIDNVLVQIKK